MTTTLLRHARLIDGSGAAPIDADVLVDGERIARIGPPGSLGDAPADATLELAGATLMPGLIEPHAHLSFVDQATPHAFSTIPVEEHLLLTLKHANLPDDDMGAAHDEGWKHFMGLLEQHFATARA